MTTSAEISALKEFTSCDVADSLIKLGVPKGGLLPGLSLRSSNREQAPVKLVGPAYTVKYEYFPEDRSGIVHWPQHYVDSAPEGSVILISCPRDMMTASWGGLTTKRAQLRGVAGTVVDGGIRDIEEQIEFGYTSFSRFTSPTAPICDAYVSRTEAPVTITQGASEIIVSPGDIICGDINGVVCVPKALVSQTIELVQRLVAAETKAMEAIAGGMSMTEASKLRVS